MEVPPRSRNPGGFTLPSISIFTDDDDQRHLHTRHDRYDPAGSRSPYALQHAPSPSAASTPVSIGSLSEDQRVPPPLPPPRFVPVPPGQISTAGEEFERRAEHVFKVAGEEVPNYKMRTDHDEGYHSMSQGREQSCNSSGKFGSFHDQFQFRSSAHAYDNALLKKFDANRPLAAPNRSPPRLGSLGGLGGPSVSPNNMGGYANNTLRPDRLPALQTQGMSLPNRAKQHGLSLSPSHNSTLLDSPGRYMDTPLNSAVSPRSTPFSHYGSDNDRSPGARTRRTNSGSMTDDTSHMDTPMEDDANTSMEEAGRLRDTYLDTPSGRSSSATDHHLGIGMKRRASSPPSELPPLHGMASSDSLRWRDGHARGSPAPRLSGSAHDVLPSIAHHAHAHAHSHPHPHPHPHAHIQYPSYAARRPSYGSNNYGASVSPSASGTGGLGAPFSTSLPHGLPSMNGGVSPTEATGSMGQPVSNSASNGASPYISSIPLTISPRSTVTRGPQQRQREHAPTVASPTRRQLEIAKAPAGVLKRSEFFMCECCPKKPKKFDTEDQLRAHELEKQYECNYCGNRFKNKNEAERHQNSLHVRRHSWSCAAMTGYDRAFHDSTFHPGQADTCGYCGLDFERTGYSTRSSNGPRRAISDNDWDERIRHLQEVHKFRECNASKKFFRADHFRQHLKHSHAGTSGRWTNMLENACMMEEEAPQPIR